MDISPERINRIFFSWWKFILSLGATFLVYSWDLPLLAKIVLVIITASPFLALVYVFLRAILPLGQRSV